MSFSQKDFMATAYSYDDKAITCPFFFVVALLLVFVPATVIFARYHFQNFTKPVVTCSCKPCNGKSKKFYRKRRRSYSNISFILSLALLVAGWITIISFSTTIHASRRQIEIWDPLRILGVSAFSSAAYIKQQFKRMSKIYHPDKRPPGMSKYESEVRFIDITKAYKALTNEAIRECYLIYGHLETVWEVSVGIALPKEIVKDEKWSNVLLFGYVTFISIVVPVFAGFWWIRSQSTTTEGLHETTAHRFFVAASQRRNLDLSGLITFFSECNEVTTIVKTRRKGLDVNSLSHIYAALPTRREIVYDGEFSPQYIAEMLVYVHLNRCSLSKGLEVLKDEIIPIYPSLAKRFLIFLTETKCSELVERAIIFMQTIKQASFPGSPPSDLPCQKSIPRMFAWNTHFRVIGESQVFTESKIIFSYHALLHNSSDFTPVKVEMEDSDDEEGDVNVLLRRKKRKNDGDKQILPEAHTPYYPEYNKPGWYAFLTCPSRRDGFVTSPVLISDVPFANSKLKPRRLRFQFTGPSVSQMLNLKLNIMSDTYMGYDFETEVTLYVVPRKINITKAIYGYHEDSLHINKENLERALNKLAINAGEENMEKKLENVFVEFYAQKEARKMALQEAKSKATQKLESGDNDPKSESPEIRKDENQSKVNNDTVTESHSGTNDTEESLQNDMVSQTTTIDPPVEVSSESVNVLSNVPSPSETQPNVSVTEMAPALPPGDMEAGTPLPPVSSEHVVVNECSTSPPCTSTKDFSRIAVDGKPQYSPNVVASAKQATHSLWSRISEVEQILSFGLEDFIPNTTNSSAWVTMESWGLKEDYMSESILLWDCEDDQDEAWVDIEESDEENNIIGLSEGRMLFGRDPKCGETYSSEETSAVGSAAVGFTPNATSWSSEMKSVILGRESEDESESSKIALSESKSDASTSLSTPPDLERTMIEEHSPKESEGTSEVQFLRLLS